MDSFWDFFWLVVEIFLLMAYLLVMFQILMDLFRDRGTSGGMKAVWVLCLIVFPVITAVVYLVARGRDMAERNLAYAEAARQDQESYIRSVATGAGSPADEIARAKSLLDAGAINQQEFERMKAAALA